MADNKLKYLSKKMSYALRHNPDKYGIKLNDYGYTDLSCFIDALNRVHHLTLTRDDITAVIAHSTKQRFEIKGDRICALYGHSLPGIIHHRVATPPAILYHGTARRFLPSIRELGLLPMQRQFVHLSTDIQTAQAVGRRHDSQPVVLEVDTHAAQAAGIQLYVGNDQVWLADEIPARFLYGWPENLINS
ncbi:MAG: RNA 2'-phosphotransferase [Limosilactobacillus pontis]|uniref:Probable RNA 2'-phosphotransferase n=1 Tax=Limosilactobacillus pontis TaxID=35787 RepID=A0A2J6NM97_9LACO|nr:RNA 2'-phosphotransferase [Limosilactobacillus pontis]PMB82452.1 RNA 2'-phosphotransferase [Limosilactobacillus pontis]